MLSPIGVASLVVTAAFIQPATTPPTDTSYVLGYTMKTIDGKDQDLSAYKGKVVMIVNVASKCGLTPQYEGLQALYEKDKDAGLVILGFPANEFGSQEPGTNEEIKSFCTGTYHVTFPMFEKIVVKGEGTHPLYTQLAAQPAPIGGEPKWNFTKFLVDRQGHVVARFEPKVKPDDPALLKKIDELLHEKPGGPKEPEPTRAGS
jgi:glutathione peroxidase